MLKLVLPNIKYKESFVRNFLPHMAKSRIKYFLDDYTAKKISVDFAGFVKMLRQQEKGLRLFKGAVPQTVYWLILNNSMIGWLSVRHRLNKALRLFGGHIGYEVSPKFRGKGYGKKMLELGLKKAKKLGIAKVVITCDIDNMASKRVIQSNGGIFKERVLPSKDRNEKFKFMIHNK